MTLSGAKEVSLEKQFWMQIHNGKMGLFCIFCNKPCISYLLDFKYRVTFDKSFAMWGKTADKDIKLKQWAAKKDNGLGCSKAICVCVVGGGDRQEETLKVCSSAFLKNGPLLPQSAGCVEWVCLCPWRWGGCTGSLSTLKDTVDCSF